MFWKTLVLATIPVLIEYYAEEYRKEDLRKALPVKSSGYHLPHVESYDFIIVGAGAAGCVLASRLSENPNVTVLLLEAGGNPPPQTEIPAYSVLFRQYPSTPSILYTYQSLPLKYANNSVIRIVVGKTMGGSSTINSMWFNRGSPKDFDNWANITGDISWSYTNVLQHFKNVETYQGEFQIGEEHGTRGPITISKQNFNPIAQEWLAAGLEKGYKIRDPNGPQMIGFAPVEYNRKKGRRHSSYLAYLKPHESQRPNLSVVRYAQVTEILIDENNKAYGVMYKRHNILYCAAYAKKEIIVSAGTYGSPQLLMKSGVGPSEILDKAKIKIKANLPVGRNLQDHPVVKLRFFAEDSSVVVDPNTAYNQEGIDEFESKGTGPLSFNGILGQAFLISSVAAAENESDWSDFQSFSKGYPPPPPWESNETGTPFEHIIGLNRPKSRGFVSIDPDNLNGPPLINFNWLHDQRDIKIFMEGIKSSIDLYESTSVFKLKGIKLPKNPIQQCAYLTYLSDEYWECFIRHSLQTQCHPAGTCRMGQGKSDPDAVVDSQLRVIGVAGLRVCDASIMPDITNANLQAAVYMIAEKTSSEIKSTWGF